MAGAGEDAGAVYAGMLASVEGAPVGSEAASGFFFFRGFSFGLFSEPEDSSLACATLKSTRDIVSS